MTVSCIPQKAPQFQPTTKTRTKITFTSTTAYSNSAIRFADGDTEIVYKFDIKSKIEPTVTLKMNQHYTISVSSDAENWTEFLTKFSGPPVKDHTINPYDYGIYKTLYIRLTAPAPSDGGGAAIHSFTFNCYTEGADTKNYYYTVLDDEVKGIVEQLSKEIPATPVDGYDIHTDGGMIYNPISQEKADQLNKYDDA